MSAYSKASVDNKVMSDSLRNMSQTL